MHRVGTRAHARAAAAGPKVPLRLRGLVRQRTSEGYLPPLKDLLTWLAVGHCSCALVLSYLFDDVDRHGSDMSEQTLRQGLFDRVLTAPKSSGDRRARLRHRQARNDRTTSFRGVLPERATVVGLAGEGYVAVCPRQSPTVQPACMSGKIEDVLASFARHS